MVHKDWPGSTVKLTVSNSLCVVSVVAGEAACVSAPWPAVVPVAVELPSWVLPASADPAPEADIPLPWTPGPPVAAAPVSASPADDHLLDVSFCGKAASDEGGRD